MEREKGAALWAAHKGAKNRRKSEKKLPSWQLETERVNSREGEDGEKYKARLPFGS